METLARRKQVSFSIPIFPAGLAALVRADAPTQIRDVLSGREPPYRPLWRASIATSLAKPHFFSGYKHDIPELAHQASSMNSRLMPKSFPLRATIKASSTCIDRSSDVLFGERSILLDAKKRNPAGRDLIVLDRLFTYEPLAFALALGNEDLRLLVDKSLSPLSRSGETQSLYKRFFGEPDENALTFSD